MPLRFQTSPINAIAFIGEVGGKGMPNKLTEKFSQMGQKERNSLD